jgi:hypothetical protein
LPDSQEADHGAETAIPDQQSGNKHNCLASACRQQGLQANSGEITRNSKTASLRNRASESCCFLEWVVYTVPSVNARKSDQISYFANRRHPRIFSIFFLQPGWLSGNS